MNGVSCVQNVSAVFQNDEKIQDFGILDKNFQETAGISP